MQITFESSHPARFLQKLKQLVQRKSLSEEHRVAWNNFENMRRKFSNIFHISTALGQLL